MIHTRSFRRLFVIALFFWTTTFLSACVTETITAPTTTVDIPTAAATEGPRPTEIPIPQENGPNYAVVRVPRGEKLIIRQPAGQSGTEVGELEWNAKNIHQTGNRTLLGSSLWVEIEFGVDGLGWVNSMNLTEAIPADAFCADQMVIDLLNSLRVEVEEQDDVGLAGLLNANRGLTVRLNWYSAEIHYTVEQVLELFSNLDEVEWGTMADSGLTVVGTFQEVIVPKLEDGFLRSPEATCNALKYGSTAGQILWPEELTNMKFYGVFRSSEADGNEFDWRSWAVGIEYANGTPFIATLIHYSSEL
jgi:hypothetical protein